MIVILGGGLAGMATAWFLGDTPHVVLESEATPGGLCRTRVVDGFHFDYTGHLLHLRDRRIVDLVEELLPGVFETIVRDARIRTRGVTLPFPFQANLHGLPSEIVADCIVGVAEVAGQTVPTDPTISFRDWSLAVLGRGISDAFMFPYNGKLFLRDPGQLTADWVSWAVPRPSLREVVNGALGIVNRGQGYNSTFRYPRLGGIGALPDAFARRMSSLRTETRVVSVDLSRREVVTENGETFRWDRLVSTLPLPALLRLTTGGPSDWAAQADRLAWTVVGCLNLGFDRAAIGGGAHWIYFPDPDVPFYRIGFPSNMTAGSSPAGTSSVYVEFALPPGEHPDPAVLEAETLEVMQREAILGGAERVIARDFTLLDPGYVIFDRARQEVMARVVPELEASGVRLIGRYGAWTYSYMERAMLDGLETAEALRAGR